MAGTLDEQLATVVPKHLPCDPGRDYRLFEGTYRNAEGTDMRFSRWLSVHDTVLGAVPGNEIRRIFEESSIQLFGFDREVQEGMDREVRVLVATKSQLRVTPAPFLAT